jgi:hypothetical protein
VKVIITGHGRKARKEAVVQNSMKRLMAMTDLSSGGCCLQTSRPLPRGELVKLHFEPFRGKPVVALGKIVDSSATGRMYYNIHVMFTRASSMNLNRINEYVYDFA